MEESGSVTFLRQQIWSKDTKLTNVIRQRKLWRQLRHFSFIKVPVTIKGGNEDKTRSIRFMHKLLVEHYRDD